MERLIVGCGYLGGRVADQWLAGGGRVYATTRDPRRAGEFRAAGLEPVVCDVLRPDTLAGLPKVDIVLYCVGLDRGAGASMREVYVGGLANVLDSLAPPRRFLYVSSTSVYGQTDGAEVDEDAVTEPVEESGKVVLEAERLLHEKLPEAVILRFAGIYGPGRLMLRKQVEAGEPLPGDPARWLNLIHVADGAAAVLAAAAHARTGAVYNVSDDRPVRRGEFYRQVANVLGAPEPRFDPTKDPGRGGNRRVSNRKMHAELGLKLRYPTCQEGLAASR